MQVLYERCAAVDVGKDVIAVAVRLPGDGPDGRQTVKRTFKTFYGVLREAARWLVSLGVTHVAMEATGIYSMPVYHALLEHGDFEKVLVCNAGHVKNVPGRLDLGRGDEAAGQQPAFQQVHQPLGVGEIRFAARHVLDMPGVAHQHLLEVPVLDQGVVDRHRVDPRGLHRHVRDTQPGQPAGRLGEHPVKRLERALDRAPAVRPVPGHPDRHRDHVLAHIDRGAPLIQHLHACLLPERRYLRARRPRSPVMS